ncbi:transposase [Burkholderia ubonensis]|uniref:Transposase n=1 Tax=Burkholderia ubonensis TaxID=101571 RepID=A0A125DMA3_9BURK|nr:RNA-guided endonuclease TnpB family protein [Burkholderia ubonensis]KWA83775.1 transposase [Burkholderia ubonensis]
MLRTHKIRLVPTDAQVNHLARACGVARFAWNWALARWQAQYEAHRLNPALAKPNEGALRRELNALKRTEFPWMLEVTKCAPQEAIINLGKAYQNWFGSLSGKRRGPKVHAPQFKKKGQRDSFKCSAGTFDVDASRIRIPNLGWVRMRESLRFAGRPVSVTVSRTAHAWFAAITLETEDTPARCESQAAVGVDLGLKALATFSDGTEVQGPKALGTLLQRLRRLSRAHSRKEKGSANRRKSAQRLARLHWRISNVRQDALHKLTHRLTANYGFMAIEDLNVKGMLSNRRLARHIADAGFGEFRRQLEYKAAQRGTLVEVVDRWYPSSKRCSACGAIHEALTLADRAWGCGACGVVHDRDLNAARNLLAEGIRLAATISVPGAGMTVCGEEGSGSGRKTRTKPASMKQTVKHNAAPRPPYA